MDQWGLFRVFLVLDAYYLALERAFIKLQNWFVKKLHQGSLKPDDVTRWLQRALGFSP